MGHDRRGVVWCYNKLEVRPDILEALPEGYTAEVYKVRSGDSGKDYHVQILHGPHLKDCVLCNCNSGYFNAMLTVLGLSDFHCKHVKNLFGFLGEKSSRR